MGRVKASGEEIEWAVWLVWLECGPCAAGHDPSIEPGLITGRMYRAVPNSDAGRQPGRLAVPPRQSVTFGSFIVLVIGLAYLGKDGWGLVTGAFTMLPRLCSSSRARKAVAYELCTHIGEQTDMVECAMNHGLMRKS